MAGSTQALASRQRHSFGLETAVSQSSGQGRAAVDHTRSTRTYRHGGTELGEGVKNASGPQLNTSSSHRDYAKSGRHLVHWSAHAVRATLIHLVREGHATWPALMRRRLRG
jgi:hypothetical protein